MAEGIGVAALLLALVFLGSWLPLLELSRKVGARLHGERHEAHCSLDYVVSYVVSSAIPAAIFAGVSGGDGAGGEGGGAGAMAALVTFACLGGVCVMLGNITLSRAAAMRDGIQLSTGMPIQASMTVSLGTSLNYFLQPDRSRPLPLALGVGAFLLAIASSAVASQRMGSPRTITVSEEEPSDPPPAREVDGLIAGEPGEKGGGDASPSGAPGRYALESDLPADFLSPPSRMWSARAVSLLIVVIGGFALGGFTPCFNISVNDQFGSNKSRGGLSVWFANLYFAIGFGVSAVALNLGLMYRPPRGSARSTVAKYVLDLDRRGRALAAAAGFINAIGNTLQFYGAELAGFAAADLVQAYPLVGTLLGYFLLGELRGMDRLTLRLVVCGYVSYLGAIALMIVSIRPAR